MGATYVHTAYPRPTTDKRPLAALASPIDPLALQKLKAQQRHAVAVRRECEARQEARRVED